MKFSMTDPREVKKFFVIFYVVGALGFTIPALSPFFILMIPYALLLNFAYLVYFHPDKRDLRPAFLFFGIFLMGFALEIAGVQTGKIFGTYTYGESLGIKLLSTPLIIGLNWVFLVYTTSSLFEKVKVPDVIKIILASLSMVAYDLVLEIAAPELGMWFWEEGYAPFQNYVAWFVASLAFHSLVKILRIKTGNPLSGVILLCQFLFFVIVVIVMQFRA